jgi:hypothetical protein
MHLSTKSDSDRKYFELLASFWTGPGGSVDLAAVESGISNVYSTPAERNALVAFSVQFKNVESAEAFARAIGSRVSRDPAHLWVYQKGRLVTGVSRHPVVEEKCVAPLRRHLERLGDAV